MPVEPPVALTQFRFTNRYAQTFDVLYERDAFRSYSVSGPQGESPEDMFVARYFAAAHHPADPLVIVYASRTVAALALLNGVARSAARYLLDTHGGPPLPPGLHGITWPLHVRAGARIAAHDYTGFRLRGAAGCVRPILPGDYGTVAFWVEPNGVEPGAPS
jgi:hypothetical protein